MMKIKTAFGILVLGLALTASPQAQQTSFPTGATSFPTGATSFPTGATSFPTGPTSYGTPLSRPSVPNRTVSMPQGACQGMDYWYGNGRGGYGFGLGTQRFGDQNYDQGSIPGLESRRRGQEQPNVTSNPFNYDSSPTRGERRRTRSRSTR